ncbi:N-acetylmuramoyl-L-alanine amidase [Paenibacillus oryzisoli]|uniref:N-acetylmuramoyl-L-alanine amidase n=1 Tax=Paenibacillus oryzisoli TaxID=1850517 RepID=A0A197ZXR2_9BACL|nr:N-acetylmuramoyl-L-alanine amidase [Paenibacillus oryzisoli]OAS13775.1 N-acetylmuramoyl-L-alanine amidase [Paenibacillus oryzisoli]
MMTVEDANKIIAFLSAAYFATSDPEAQKEFNRLANEVRKASGQPPQ